MGTVRQLVKDSSGLGEGVAFRTHLLNLGSGGGGDITLLEVSGIEIAVADEEYVAVVDDDTISITIDDTPITLIVEDE